VPRAGATISSYECTNARSHVSEEEEFVIHNPIEPLREVEKFEQFGDFVFLLASCCIEDASCCVGAAGIIEMLAYMCVIFSVSGNCVFGLQSALSVAGP